MTTRFLALVVAAATTSATHAQNITVYSSGNVTVGTSRQLTAYVPLSPSTVTWSVNGVTGGNSTVGTVSASGLYQAPGVIPAANTVSVRATSTAFPAKSHAVNVTITQPPVQLWSTSPRSVPAGPFAISLNGSNFTAASIVRFGGVNLPTTFVSPTRLTATGTAPPAQAGTNVLVRVVNGGVGGTTSSAVQLTVTAAGPPPPPPPPVTVAVLPAAVSLTVGGTQSFTAGVAGTTNTTVNWSVNGIAGGNTTVGTISAGGLYTAPAAVPTPAIVTVRATSAANTSASSTASVAIAAIDGGPGAGTGNLAAARLLEQAAFGPTPAAIARVKAIGVDAWLDEQFALPETPISNPGGMAMSAVQAAHLHRLATAPDQLRQRVASALAGIIVVSANKNIYPDELVPYLQILSRHAFGNYRALLGEISTSAQMGKYLDLANSNKPGPGGAANENYARELMQLFTIGLYALNPDGSRQVDAQGLPIRAYTQHTVQQVALALTGWTYQGPANNNWENFSGPLQAREFNHDTSAKTFVGASLPAGQNTVADMEGTLNWLFAHPNVGPFVSSRLILALVKSNPTPAYVARVSSTFDNNGAGVRGDLKAVVRAVLSDPEARNDTATGNTGRLKDAIYHIVSFVRALGGSISPANQQAWQFSQMGQTPLAPPSVFGYYSPLFRIPRTTLAGPEFQIYGPTEAVLRGNMFWSILSSNAGSDLTVDIAPFTALAENLPALIDAVDQALLYGRMPAAMRQSLATAIAAQYDARAKAQTALYLTALSGLYAVQH
ncbi:MAG: DUF1800 domain-containing protein [Opitutaceae bacterium]|nr:DUF1800 domain-containing protein [Opitutaceae bacterium]